MGKIFPLRKYLILMALVKNGGVIDRDILALKLDIERSYTSALLKYYAKQGLVKRLGEKLNLWKITPKGLKRLAFLKARLEVENVGLLLPPIRMASLEWELKKEKYRT